MNVFRLYQKLTGIQAKTDRFKTKSLKKLIHNNTIFSWRLLSLSILMLCLSIACSKDEEEQSSDWIEISSPTNNSLTDIVFHTNDFAVVSGYFGTLLKSDDGGESWQMLDPGINHSLLKVFILNTNEFFTCRLGLYKTDNGGASFSEWGDFSSSSTSISDLHFFSSNEGIICKGSSLYKTKNGGFEWVNVYEQFGYANILQFPTDSIAYLAGGRHFDNINYSEFHKTVDGGENWFQLNLSGGVSNASITSMYFLSETTGYVSNSLGEFYKTQNGGSTWEFRSKVLNETFHDLVFISEDNGFAIGSNTIYTTDNGGIHWSKDYQNLQMTFSSISIKPNNEVWIVGSEGLILKKVR